MWLYHQSSVQWKKIGNTQCNKEILPKLKHEIVNQLFVYLREECTCCTRMFNMEDLFYIF